MSVFDKNVIEKELDYRPDPFDNVNFQLARYFNYCCDLYNPSNPTDIITFVKQEMTELLYSLDSNFAFLELLDCWKDWKGPVVYINDFCVDRMDFGIHISWRAMGYDDWNELYLKIDPTGYMERCKNWVM